MFENKVAVVTGAGSGIGKALALHCAAAGMRLALADVDAARLAATAAELEEGGCPNGPLPVRDSPGRGCPPPLTAVLDVSDATAMGQFAERCFAELGGVDLLFNNAGILRLGPIWTHTEAEWQAMLAVNIMGVVNGLNAFVPRLIAAGRPAHIVNTGSVGSLVVAPGMGQYGATKMAVRAITEALAYDLAEAGAAIDVSLLCPGPVMTSIVDSLKTGAGAGELEEMHEALAVGPDFIEPRECAERVFEGIRRRRFWIFTHPFKRHYGKTVDAVLNDINPSYEPVVFDTAHEGV